MTIDELRQQLADKRLQLDREVKKFNDLHRQAKYLKNKMIVTRRELDAIEKQIEIAKRA